MRSLTIALLCVSSLTLLSACGAHTAQVDHSASSNTIDTALERAAAKVPTQESLPFLEAVYKRNSDDPKAAIAYSKALRGADDAKRASLILTPFATAPEASSAVKAEYAAVQLALGNYDAAAEYAQQAVDKQQDNCNAYNYLAVAQDANGLYSAAEGTYRAALELCEDQSAYLMNNLALNLVSQKRNAEALEVISKAAALAPARADIQTNYTFIKTLTVEPNS